MTPQEQEKLTIKTLEKAAEAIPVMIRILKEMPGYCASRSIDPNAIESMKIYAIVEMMYVINKDVQTLNISDSEKYELAAALNNVAKGTEVISIIQKKHYGFLELISAIRGRGKSTDN